MMILAVTLLVLSPAPLSLAAQEAASDDDPADLLGMTLAELWARSAPAEVYPLRGEDSSLDDVVFFYADYRYLYLYNNRVWQVRWDRRSTAPVRGLTPGMTPGQVRDAWGEARQEVQNSWYYLLEDRGWPLEARLIFSAEPEGRLTDIYLYRGDF